MKIEFVEIQNFRKLVSCRIDLDKKETIFVGANNSGKTSAMDALILFLKDKTKFTTRDFTLSNWIIINEIGKSWVNEVKQNTPDLTLEKWYKLLPQLDVWLNVAPSEIYYVSHLIPTLDWQSGLLGVRLILKPKNIENLFRDFLTSFNLSRDATKITAGSKKENRISLKLWPFSMWDFLEKRLHNHFEIHGYILDPTKLKEPVCGEARPQVILPDSIPLDGDPFKGLIKIHIINAQRGFSDPNAPDNIGNLSTQLRDYFTKHLDPTDKPEPSDIGALEAIEEAKSSFDARLKESFKSSLDELETLNYPGFGNPRITISSKVSPIDGLNHSSAVQFDVLNKDDDVTLDSQLRLPEKYNGLGYQNLISMVFKLISFRDEWMQVGKIYRATSATDDTQVFEPLHLVLIEEPEAHLHAQIQQVFIRKAYNVLRNHKNLKEGNLFSTQLVISTHSNHIAHEIDFVSLRYFRRKPATQDCDIPTSTVVNLSKTFGSKDETTKFAIRYLKTTHCDLFFADGVILIEGPAERMLIPHFIQHNFPGLTSSYISLLEIGGSHAHRLKPLIEDLGLITLVVTDLDSIDPKDNNRSVIPERGKGYKTGNNTLKSWLPQKNEIDALFALNDQEKISKSFPIRVAYQFPVMIKFEKGKEEEEAIPYTFEDSLIFENIELFKTFDNNGIIKKFSTAAKKLNSKEAGKEMFDILKTCKKAEFALELLFLKEPDVLKVPLYIYGGLKWLQEMLKSKQQDFVSKL